MKDLRGLKDLTCAIREGWGDERRDGGKDGCRKGGNDARRDGGKDERGDLPSSSSSSLLSLQVLEGL